MIGPDSGMAAVLRQLRHRGGGGFEWYKDGCLARRVEVRMRARGVPTLAGYATLLARDADEADHLLDALSIRVTGFFRNPESWARLAELVDRELPGGDLPCFAWSMGCSTGEEVWSLAMLLCAGGRGRFQVVGSDIDAGALETAEAGRYDGTAARAVHDALGRTFGRIEDSRFVVDEQLRPRVRFRREDLTRARPAPEGFDLVCCRNLLIFLGPEGQRRILERAVRSLRLGGLLMLGRTESPLAAEGSGLVPLDRTHRIYRKAS